MTVAINYALKLSQKRKISGNRNVFHLFLTVLHELGLDGEAPHGVQRVPGELHLVEDLAAHLHHLVGGELKIKSYQWPWSVGERGTYIGLYQV